MVDTKTQWASAVAATARRTCDGSRATSTTASQPPSASAAGDVVGAVPPQVGGALRHRAGLAAAGAGDVPAARHRLERDLAGEEPGAAEHEELHGPHSTRPRRPPTRVFRCQRNRPRPLWHRAAPLREWPLGGWRGVGDGARCRHGFPGEPADHRPCSPAPSRSPTSWSERGPQEAERLTADLAVLREETRRLMVETERDRAEAGRARKQADDVLAGASEEAATIVLDANEQAALLMRSADGCAGPGGRCRTRSRATGCAPRRRTTRIALRAESQELRDTAATAKRALLEAAKDRGGRHRRRRPGDRRPPRRGGAHHRAAPPRLGDRPRPSPCAPAPPPSPPRMLDEASHHAEELRRTTRPPKSTASAVPRTRSSPRRARRARTSCATLPSRPSGRPPRSAPSSQGAATEADSIRRAGHADVAAHTSGSYDVACRG